MAHSRFPDLVIEANRHPGHRGWLEPWPGLPGGLFAVCFLNRFGCWFIERPGGQVEIFDVFYGLVEPVAGSVRELAALVDDASWREVYLLSESVFQLHAAGKVARDTHCYALAPPPLFGGPDPWSGEPLRVEAVTVVEVLTLQGLYAQYFRTSREVEPA